MYGSQKKKKKDKHTHKLVLDLKATPAMNICCIVNSETRLTPFIKLNLLYWCCTNQTRQEDEETSNNKPDQN